MEYKDICFINNFTEKSNLEFEIERISSNDIRVKVYKKGIYVNTIFLREELTDIEIYRILKQMYDEGSI